MGHSPLGASTPVKDEQSSVLHILPGIVVHVSTGSSSMQHYNHVFSVEVFLYEKAKLTVNTPLVSHAPG